MLVIYLRGEVGENEKEYENTFSMNSEVDLCPSTSEEFHTSWIHSPGVDTVFSCEVCDKAFQKKQDLQRHYSFHIVRKPFVCKKCNSSFMRESAVTMHRCPADVQPVNVHTEVPNQITSMQTERAKPINEKPYICEVCDVKFMCKSNLKIHLKNNKCITAYNCPMCRCNFKQLSSLARHHNKIHLGVDLKEDPEENDYKSNQPDSPHTCEVCGMKFSKKVYLIEHLPVHKGEKALTEFQENLVKEEILVSKFEEKKSMKPSKCEICGQKFTKRYDIMQHMSTHTGEKAYKCDVCGKRYVSKATLLVHRRRFHSGLRPFACDLCPKAFLRKPELETHYFTHEEYKPYTCGDCKTGFCHRKSLERHIRMQTCVGAPQNTSYKNIAEHSFKKELNNLKASENSDSDDLNFSWSPTDMRRTRSRTALIARQKATFKAFKKSVKNENGDLFSKNSEESEHLNKKQNTSQNHEEFSLVGEQSSIQQYFPSRHKIPKTSNASITEINQSNPRISKHDFNSTEEESYYFSCNLGQEVFETKQGLLKHHYIHNRESSTKQDTKKDLKPYVCHICGICFRLKQDLTAHSDVHKSIKNYICVDCNFSFNNESHFASHPCKDNELNINEQSFEKLLADQAKLNDQMKIHEDNNLFECSVCSKSFGLEKDLKYHLASHALNKGFFCNICPKAFYLEKDLNSHVLSHSKKKSFACKLCYENFDVLKNLNRHLLTHWSSGFFCRYCHQGFNTEEDLKSHVDACPSRNNFICNVCHKSFLLKCALVSHAKTHQRALVDKQFSCKFCPRSFLCNLDLRQHLRSHSGEKCYFCEECGKGYFLKASLRAHLRYHSSNRPHACDRCDKKYVCKRDLDIHYLKHTDGIAPYICDTCGQGFCLEKGLEKHLISEHGKAYKKGTKKKQDISSDCSEIDVL